MKKLKTPKLTFEIFKEIVESVYCQSWDNYTLDVIDMAEALLDSEFFNLFKKEAETIEKQCLLVFSISDKRFEQFGGNWETLGFIRHKTDNGYKYSHPELGFKDCKYYYSGIGYDLKFRIFNGERYYSLYELLEYLLYFYYCLTLDKKTKEV